MSNKEGWSDDYCYEQLEWRSQPTWGVYEDDEARLRRDARFGGEALSRMVGCFEAPPRKAERPEPEAKLDTMPAQQARRQRPVIYRDRWPVLLGQWWTKIDGT
jgi:hypothetical protein